MRTAWRILAVVGALALVLVAGAYVALSTLDLNAFIGPVKDRVKAATGRELTMRGDARLALSMQPRIVLNDVALANAPWATAKEIVTAERLELELALLPLLSRRFELTEVTLVGPVVALETDAKGQRNWNLGKGTGAAAATGDAGAPAGFGIANLAITRGKLTYRDGATGSVTPVAIDRLALHARSATAPIAAEFSGRVDDVPVSVQGTLGPVEALLQQRWPYAVDLKGEIAGRKTALATRITASGALYRLDDLKVSFGANVLTGAFAVRTGGARPKLEFDLTGQELALNALPVPVSVASTDSASGPAIASTPARKGGRAYLFSDAPISFAALRFVDASGSLAVGRLTLPDGRPLQDLKVALVLADGRLQVSKFSLALMGGSVSGAAAIDAAAPDNVSVTLQVTGKELALGDILAAAGRGRDVRGGKTDVTAELSMRGASLHAWASTASGNVRVVVGPATLMNTKLDLDQALDKLSQAVNPFRESDPSTELECAVARLPLANGVANVDRSIAMETKQLGVSASGTLDFRNETLDFTFKPQVRKGISVAIPNLSDLVRLSGPFASPQVKVDAMGSAMAIASIGAAIGTGGLSALGQTLYSWAEGSGPGPCQVALGATASRGASADTATPSGAARNPIDEIGKAVGKLFGK